MPKLIWDDAGNKIYETGIQQGVLFVQDVAGKYPSGIAWNGLISVSESPSGAESNKSYADNGVYLNLMSAEEFGATVEAYTYPDEFAACDGSAEIGIGVNIGQQTRKSFGLAYKTLVGNDTEGDAHGYKLHLIYGALASPSEKAYQTINDSPEAITFSWELSTTPVNVTGKKATSCVVIDSTKADPAKLLLLETMIFGGVATPANLPLPDEIATMFTAPAPAALSMTTIVPADDASGIAATANIVITFNNKIASEAVVVTSDAGLVVAGTKTWDVDKKVLTFNPTGTLTADTYIVAIGGVVDIYGQTLADTVKNFTTI